MEVPRDAAVEKPVESRHSEGCSDEHGHTDDAEGHPLLSGVARCHAGALALHSRYFTTPCFFPTFTNAAIARSMCSGVCAAEICTRMRAWPFGTTGKKKPIT